MPSITHEAFVEMVRERPSLVADLLTEALHYEIPPFEKAVLTSGELTDVTPAPYRADAVVTLHQDDKDKPELAVIFEVQLGLDPKKLRTWPVYFATVHARLNCPVLLLVLCIDESIAAWSAGPIAIGWPTPTSIEDAGMLLTPLVLCPSVLPAITGRDEARRHPELSVLSVLAHGARTDSSPLFEALLSGLEKIDLEHAKLYTDLIVMSLPAAAKRRLEEIMTIAQEQGNEFAGAYLPNTFARGREAGKAEGKAEGIAKGKADAVLAILAARNVEVSPEVRDRITTCTDIDRLDTWVHRAVLVTDTTGLFA